MWLRNARLGFRQQEENHILENAIYNELKSRDFNVDVGVVNITWLLHFKMKKRW